MSDKAENDPYKAWASANRATRDDQGHYLIPNETDDWFGPAGADTMIALAAKQRQAIARQIMQDKMRK